MNRIILIGNGFDLAHGLDTKYSNFIEYYWIEKIKFFKDNPHLNYEDDEVKINIQYYGGNIPSSCDTYHKVMNDKNIQINIKNEYLKIISTIYQDCNWVDIENVYFSELLSIVNAKKMDTSLISKLNKEFLLIKNALEEYLSNELKKKRKTLSRNSEISEKIFSKISLRDFSSVGFKTIQEYIFEDIKSTIDKSNSSNPPKLSENRLKLFKMVTFKDDDKFQLETNKTFNLLNNRDLLQEFVNGGPPSYLFLNFNYTDIESYYSSNSEYIDRNGTVKSININIHGELNNKSNPIIFGYGDEIGKEYKLIEEKINNDLLENVKSIKYLDTNNYKRLLEYIESDKYQILIMGHSCGNSDRTLLNTLFEHENCVSIKVYYHQINENEDNYSDVIRNISRNFNDKKMMRDKVVNKKYCSPLVKM